MKSILMNFVFIGSLGVSSLCYASSGLEEEVPSHARTAQTQERSDAEERLVEEYSNDKARFLQDILACVRGLSFTSSSELENAEFYKASLARTNLFTQNDLDNLFPNALTETEKNIARTFLSFYGCSDSKQTLVGLMAPIESDYTEELYIKRINALEKSRDIETIKSRYIEGATNFIFKKDQLIRFYSSFRKSANLYTATFLEAAETPFKTMVLGFLKARQSQENVLLDFFKASGFTGKCSVDKVRKFESWITETSKTFKGKLRDDSTDAIHKLRNKPLTWDQFITHIIGVFTDQTDKKIFKIKTQVFSGKMSPTTAAGYIVNNIKADAIFDLKFMKIILTDCPVLFEGEMKYNAKTRALVTKKFGEKAKLVKDKNTGDKTIVIDSINQTLKNLIKESITAQLQAAFE